MAGQKYNKAYEAYQQAVYRDGRNPPFGARSVSSTSKSTSTATRSTRTRAPIRINPYISEVWFDLGSLYESCNNQISDAIDAYARASELDPGNHLITQRLQLLRQAQATGGQLPAAPGPQDVHPTAYASAAGPPTMSGSMGGLGGPPMLMHSGPTPRSIFSRSEGNNGVREAPPEGGIALPSPHPQSATAPPPYGGGPPPPVVLDDSRRGPVHTQLAPMEVDRPPPPSGRDAGPGGPAPFPGREQNASRGPAGHQNLLLHPPQSTPRQGPPPPPGASEHHTPRDPAYYSSNRDSRGQRRMDRSPSITPPPPQGMLRGGPGGEHPGYHGYPPSTNGAGARGPPSAWTSTNRRIGALATQP